MTRLGVALAILAGFSAAQALADDGKALFAAKGCTACHGESGAKPIAGSPVLASQNADYLARQMTEIADGTRASGPVKVMKPVIAKTSPEERKALAQWLAGQKPADPQTGDKAKAEKGADLFEENGCIGCHGADGLKPLADYPFLAAQRRDYLMVQIKAIRDEIRSTRRARLMVANVRKLSDAQIEQVAEFLSQTKRK
ncbi:Cytochrome c553 [Paramagnetospirillum magnetotacticum MS-1]|uniref:Cytochrome c553 n=1 Tax=Paramagnetospirillum magnetotacticum MS-1 TaxID=272627 RepID=A0A0C2UYP8_PARME|nr:c-type cytochrome [Paramagnetospirillum magnetotacticum]KIL97976.1 Cytochrome c553 [Paramagnetospirillum magnetotacticum MS-1]